MKILILQAVTMHLKKRLNFGTTKARLTASLLPVSTPIQTPLRRYLYQCYFKNIYKDKVILLRSTCYYEELNKKR